ncbi:peptidase C65 Otubain-domain-containing protein [Syncephalis pseudoplumigaleata]|uniref:ubiquitinyl hydrolase 1 n=1 Tax=Syncephalis pseudoplumigaleata TaxID=1712513 RepID=A0A4P9Z062_9FUNG|nr:peptidase C65 Otubain-domain-containing protein [Syncephalis pseudoplumigaleata]|eukprot:RKP25827.1 peptidase C65 Otubain-domain-containing protein [Syncephalis pseudoplumigaleata]
MAEPPPSAPTDEQILAFEQQVKDREANIHPFVGEQQPLTVLQQEYEHGSEVYRVKINELDRQYRAFRRCRGDGNCFFRAFAFAWFENALLGDQAHKEATRAALVASKQLLIDAGFEWLAVEDFYDTTLELYDQLTKATFSTAQEAVAALRARSLEEQGATGNAVVVHFRMVASAYLRKHADDYLPFIEFGQTMEQYCAQHVEAFGRESEEIHIIALTKALKVQVQVVYLDNSTANDSRVSVHTFDGQDETAPSDAGEQGSTIVLLYRPGHYDILYKR